MRRKAFTLIELLVVIAITLILAAILFPVFARARENARRSCAQHGHGLVNCKELTGVSDDNRSLGQGDFREVIT